MDQSKSSSVAAQSGGVPTTKASLDVAPPRRSFSVEFLVGIFTMAGVAAAGYLAVGLGEVSFFDADRYDVYAEFDNISGLKNGAAVEMAGVPVGNITQIALKDPFAVITLRILKGFKINKDDTLSVRTKGIIGDRYVKISRGAGLDGQLEPGGTTKNTESVVDIEDIIGKLVHNFSGDKSDEKSDGEDSAKQK